MAEKLGPADAAEWTVPAALEGERVDRALALITGLSRREINAVLDAGRVQIGRRVLTSRSRKVHEGESLRVEGDLAPETAEGVVADPSIQVPVVYADDEIVVVNKPAGLVVHPGAGQRSATLVHGLLAAFPDIAALAAGEQEQRPGIVHRLDKGTSGLLVVARTADARDSMIAQLADRTMGREYLALVHGQVASEAGVVDAPLGRSDLDPTRMRVQAGGRPARTRYEVLQHYTEPLPASFLRCKLETGRTHQIRVHLATIGHPVVADERYGRRPPGPLDERLGPGRPFLHAATLELDHPRTGERLHFEAPLPDDLAEVLEQLS